MKPDQPFFILWNPKSHLPPTTMFGTRQRATAAAKHMAQTYGGCFYVCRSSGFAEGLEIPPRPVRTGSLRKVKHTKRRRK